MLSFAAWIVSSLARKEARCWTAVTDGGDDDDEHDDRDRDRDNDDGGGDDSVAT